MTDDLMVEPNKRLLTLPELAAHTGIALSWFYERSRYDALPGQVRLGKYVRIDLGEFTEALRAGTVK